MTVKYSIVIPTRNRAEYLPYAIKSVLDSQRKDIELIVSNNFSSDATEEILSKITDPRLKVITPDLDLPMAGHYEFAISKAKGEWITILGDDDAVMPYIFESLDKHIQENPQVDIISSIRSYYFWKGCEDIYKDAVINYFSSSKTKLRSTKKDLMSVLKGLRSCFDMPQLYTTCMIKQSLYREIKGNSNGYFYHSIIPDMYSVVALCLSRDQYLRVEEPLFWVGTSNKSMGRSNRIYKDAEQFECNSLNKNMHVPRKISEEISYVLHSGSFGPMYIFECLLQSPLKNRLFRKSSIRKITFSAVLNNIKKKKKLDLDQDHLIKELIIESRKYGISKKSLYFTSFYLRIIYWLLKFQKLLSLNFYVIRFNLSPFCHKLRSNNRLKFPTILEASYAVADMLKANK